jgi:CRP/FNR family cyclic AMP-dependent transcriptional regulator
MITHPGKAVNLHLPSRSSVLVHNIPLFRGLTAEQTMHVDFSGCLHTVERGIDIISRGLDNDTLYFLLSGTVRVYLQKEEQREVVLALLGAGEVLGEISSLDGDPASASVKTMEKCRFLVIGRDTFSQWLQHFPQIYANAIRVQGHRIRRLTAHIEALTTLDTETRLVRQLLLFAEDYGVPACPEEVGGAQNRTERAIRLPLRLTQADLAALCGSCLKQINRAMAELQGSRMVAVEKGYRIVLLAPHELKARYSP